MRRTHRGWGHVFCLSFLLGCGAKDAQPSASNGDAGSDAETTGETSFDAGPPTGDPPACVGGEGSGAPTPRGDHAGALDPSGRKLVVFGGDTAVPVCPVSTTRKHTGDTWVLDVGCGTWRAIEGDAPKARARHAMAADVTGARGILFGGRARTADSGPYEQLADTWAFDSPPRRGRRSPPPARRPQAGATRPSPSIRRGASCTSSEATAAPRGRATPCSTIPSCSI